MSCKFQTPESIRYFSSIQAAKLSGRVIKGKGMNMGASSHLSELVTEPWNVSNHVMGEKSFALSSLASSWSLSLAVSPFFLHLCYFALLLAVGLAWN